MSLHTEGLIRLDDLINLIETFLQRIYQILFDQFTDRHSFMDYFHTHKAIADHLYLSFTAVKISNI